MNRIIVTLCLIMIALIGASAVAASDAGNSSDVNLNQTLIDCGDVQCNGTDDIEINMTFEDHVANETGGEIKANISETNNTRSVINESIPNEFINNSVRPNGGAIYYNGTVINNSTFTQNEDNDYDMIMKVFGEHDYGNLSDEEVMSIFRLYDEIIDCYGAGHPTQSIAKEFGMSPSEIQNIADTYFEPIQNYPEADSIYKMYGSYTLEEMSQRLGMRETEVKGIIGSIKSGTYGDFYKTILVKRDLVSLNEHTTEYII